MSEGLLARLHRRIAEWGPLTFAEFMEAALYDPEEGFYAEPPVGAEGDFLTSPHVSPVFGRLVALQLAEAFDLLGRPDPFHVVEFGAGDGTLARQVVETLGSVPQVAGRLRYVAVERSAGARRALQAAGIDTLADDEPPPRGVTGVVLANELLDNLPFHLLAREDGRLVEVFVGAADGGLGLTTGPLSDPALASLASGLEEGARGAVSPAASEWLAGAAGMLARGFVLVFDYGGTGPRPPRTYRGHRPGVELVREPGAADITAGVDFDALARAARDLRLAVWGPVTQRDALLALGFGRLAESERERTAAERDAGAHLAAARRWARRSRDSLLVDPAALGGLAVMVFGVGIDRPLACVAGERAISPEVRPPG